MTKPKWNRQLHHNGNNYQHFRWKDLVVNSEILSSGYLTIDRAHFQLIKPLSPHPIAYVHAVLSGEGVPYDITHIHIPVCYVIRENRDVRKVVKNLDTWYIKWAWFFERCDQFNSNGSHGLSSGNIVQILGWRTFFLIYWRSIHTYKLTIDSKINVFCPRFTF